MQKFLVAMLLAGCGGSSFEAGNVSSSDGAAGATSVEEDAGAGGARLEGTGGHASGAGGVREVGSGGASTGGVISAAGGAQGSGGSAPCLTDLSGVGTGDFSIHFTLTTTEHILTLGLLSQRTGCNETSAYWDVSLSPTGGIVAVTNDGAHRVFVVAGNSLNDGKPHEVDVVRRDGQFWYASDGTINSTPTPDPYSFGAFPLLIIGSSTCAQETPALGHATISNVCLTAK